MNGRRQPTSRRLSKLHIVSFKSINLLITQDVGVIIYKISLINNMLWVCLF